MQLYNCYSKMEKELKGIELQGLSTQELINLARDIKEMFDDCKLEDENIITSALLQIAEELFERAPRS